MPLTAWALARTRFGLRLRAVGENPHAVDTAGISVARLRYMAVIIAGILCGIAGAFISISLSASFVRDMTAGTGFMALAALIFANWRAWPALWCLPALWLPPGQRHIPAGQAGIGRGNPGAVHQHAALCHDRYPARRLHRKIHSAQGPAAFPTSRTDDMNDLIAAAKSARLKAYAPYSKFLVGAAVRDERGQIHGGCNIENAAYPQGWCAETSAIAAMIMSGGKASPKWR